jgi:hypothetical protein
VFKQGAEDSRANEELAASTGEIMEFYRLLYDDLGDETEFHEDEDCEGPFESMLRHASEIEAGLIPGWKLDRSHPGVLLWTTPSGRQYKSTPDGSSRLVLDSWRTSERRSGTVGEGQTT